MGLQFIRIRALIKQDNFIEYFIRLAVIVKYVWRSALVVN